jgi:polar amino acid transport system substrate-binding protein
MQYSRKIILLFLSIVVFTAPVFAITPTFRAKPIITIAADNWCPINCGSNDVRPGVGIELAKAIFEPLGYQINYVVMPWSDALAQVRAGKVSAVIGASRFDDATLIFPTQAVYNITDNFYVLRGNSWRFQGIYTLKGKKLGVIRDYGYGQAVNDYIQANQGNYEKVQFAEGEHALRDNIKKLTSRQIDVLVESGPVMEYTIDKMRLQSTVELAGTSPQAKVYLAFSPALPGSRAWAGQFDAGMRALSEAGQLDAYYGAYGLSSYER